MILVLQLFHVIDLNHVSHAFAFWNYLWAMDGDCFGC